MSGMVACLYQRLIRLVGPLLINFQFVKRETFGPVIISHSTCLATTSLVLVSNFIFVKF